MDANALDRVKGDPERSRQVDRILELESLLNLNFVLPKGVKREIENPKTPTLVKTEMPDVYTLSVGLTSDETSLRNSLVTLLRGNAKSPKHDADADHVFEASKYGGHYFITHDDRIIGNKDRISDLIGRRLEILNLEDFNQICEAYL